MNKDAVIGIAIGLGYAAAIFAVAYALGMVRIL